MDLKSIVARPELVKITLNDEDTIREFGEPVEFWTWNRQPLDVFLKLSATVSTDPEMTIKTLKTLVLDSQGQPLMAADELLPVGIMVRVLAEVMSLLGK